MRFNVDFKRYAHLDNNDLTWLQYRLRLAELTSFYALQQQSFKNFKLVIMFNPAVPKMFLQDVANKLTDLDVILFSSYDNFTKDLHALLLQNCDPDCQAIQTTRIDSDDMIHPEFMAKIAAYCRDTDILGKLAFGPQYISFPTGQDFTTSSASYNGVDYPQNAFGTLIEPIGEIKNVFSYKHNEMSKRFQTSYLAPDQSMWCRILHGSNLLNKPRALLPVKGGFPVHPDLVEFAKSPPVHPPQLYEPIPVARSRFKKMIDRLRSFVR